MKILRIICLVFAPSFAQSATIFHQIPEDRQILRERVTLDGGEGVFDFDGNGSPDLIFLRSANDRTLLFDLAVQAGTKGFILLDRSLSENHAAVLGPEAIVSSAWPGGVLGPPPPALLDGSPLMWPMPRPLGDALIYQRSSNPNGPPQLGPWVGNSGYLGFSFYHQDSEITHYGWLEMAEAEGVLRFKSWAYETEDNKSLLAGQIPEPSAFALLAASSFMLSRRKR